MQKKMWIFLGVAMSIVLSGLAKDSVSSELEGTARLKNQVVVVTGASRGIGRGIVRLFAKEGAKLVLVGRDEGLLKAARDEILAKGKKAIYIKADVGNQADMEKMIRLAVEEYGKIDVLCHNAGIYPHSRLETMTLEEWQNVINVNLTGTFLAVKTCIPIMKEQGQGKIVIISSISGPQTALPGYSHYTASKGGVAGFIKTAAVELAKYHININAVEPGNIMTEGLCLTGGDHMNNMIQAVPLGRLGTPEDIAYAALFLVSKEASYITGQSLIVDGGQTLPESHFSEY